MNKRIFSRILSVLMVVCMILSAAPVYADASPATENGLNISETSLIPGDTFTVTYKVAGISNPIASTGFKFSFDKNIFEVTELDIPTMDGCTPATTTVTAANNSGEISCIHETASGDSSMTFDDFALVATFQVKNTATSGDYDFKITSCSLYDADADIDYAPAIKDNFVTVTVSIPVKGVSLPETLSLNVGNEQTLTPTFDPADATNQNVTWSSDNTSVATVENGKVKGVAEGTAKITVTTEDGSFTDSCTVTVSCAHGNKTNHQAKTGADCSKPSYPAYSVCDDCGQKFDANGGEIDEVVSDGFGPHQYGNTYVYVNANYHAYQCSVCQAFDPNNQDAHYGGNATCSDYATCIACGEKYGTLDMYNHASNELKYANAGDGTHNITHACCGESYDTPNQAHTYKYTATDNVITGTCEEGCSYSATATLTVPTGAVYTGDAWQATITYSDTWKDAKDAVVAYYNQGETQSLSAAPRAAGTYTAKMTIGGVTAEADFAISDALGVVSITSFATEYNYGDTISDPLYEKNGTGDVYIEYKVKGSEDGTYSNVKPTNAGEYTVRVLMNADQNYTAASATRDFVINKIAPTVAITATLDKTYDGSAVALDANGYTNNSDGPVGIEYSADGGNTYTTTAPINAGNYIVRVSVGEGTNHKADSATKAFTIEKAQGNLVATAITDISKTYDGTPVGKPIYTTDCDGAVTVEYSADSGNTYTTTAPTNAGGYHVRITIADGTNYKGASATVAFYIYRADNAVEITSDISKDYDGYAVSAPEYTQLGDGTVTIEYKEKDADDSTYTTTAPTAIGSYTVRVTADVGTNHLDVSNSADFEITKGAYKIGTIDVTNTYEGEQLQVTVNKLYNTAVSSATVAIQYKPAGADDSAYTDEVPTAAGDYVVKITISGDDNYNDYVFEQPFSIVKKSAAPVIYRMESFATTTGEFNDDLYFGREGKEGDAFTLKVSTSDFGDQFGMDYHKLVIEYEVQGATQVSGNYDYNGDPIYKDGIATDFVLGKGFNMIVAKVYYNGIYVNTFDPFFILVE